MTIEDPGSSTPRSGGAAQSLAMRIFHWGRSDPAPLGTPEPPAGAAVVGVPTLMPTTTAEPPLLAVAPPAPKGKPGTWPSAFMPGHAEALTNAAVDKQPPPAPPPLEPVHSNGPATAKKVELTPLAPTSVAANPAKTEPTTLVPIKPLETKPTTTPLVVAQTPAPKTTAVPSSSPYGLKTGDPSILPPGPNYTLPVIVNASPSPSPYGPKSFDPAVGPATPDRLPPAPPVVAHASPYGQKSVDPSVGSAVADHLPPAPVVVKASPYGPKPVDPSVPDRLPPAPPVAVTGSPYALKPVDEINVPVPEVKPAPASTNVGATTPPAAPPPVLTEPPPVIVKAPAVPLHVETPPAQPSDWRDAWSKTDAVKPPMLAAPPKVDLPRAEVRVDDPLRTPEKYSKIPHTDAPDSTAPEKKTPLLALLAHDQPSAVVKVDAKQPETPAGLNPAMPPLPGPAPIAPAPKQTAPAAIVPAPMQTAPAPAPAQTKAPVAPAKPAIPLGMASVLAARSPELAPPTPPKGPQAASQSEAVGLNPNEPNAFTNNPKGGPAAVAGNAFYNCAAARREPQADALAGNAFPAAPQAGMSPAYGGALAMRIPTPAPAAQLSSRPTGYVVPAGYQQQGGYEPAQLIAVMRESLYPSQREWAAENLASMDWRRHPQILDLLIERAKRDPAPTVRAECVRSLGRMKADTVAAVETIKALQTDPDGRVRQEAVEAYSTVTGTAPAP